MSYPSQINQEPQVDCLQKDVLLYIPDKTGIVFLSAMTRFEDNIRHTQALSEPSAPLPSSTFTRFSFVIQAEMHTSPPLSCASYQGDRGFIPYMSKT